MAAPIIGDRMLASCAPYLVHRLTGLTYDASISALLRYDPPWVLLNSDGTISVHGDAIIACLRRAGFLVRAYNPRWRASVARWAMSTAGEEDPYVLQIPGHVLYTVRGFAIDGEAMRGVPAGRHPAAHVRVTMALRVRPMPTRPEPPLRLDPALLYISQLERGERA